MQSHYRNIVHPSQLLWVSLALLGGPIGLLGCGSDSSSDPGRQSGQLDAQSLGASVSAPTSVAGMGAAGAHGFGNSPTGTPSFVPSAPINTIDAGAAPDQPANCGGVEVEPTISTTVVPGNVLVIFDESLSMNEPWGTAGQSKWMVASQAVAQAIAPLQAQISAATIFFPQPGLCNVTAIDSGSQIDFLPGAQFVAAWNSYMSSHGPSGLTPTGAAMQMADAALAKSTRPGITAVVLITDGDPNCGTNDAEVNQIAAGWLAKGIHTHVFGLPGISTAASRLDALAAAGGTSKFITPNDPTALQTALAQIVGASSTTSLDSCRISLPQAPPDPNAVTLAVVEQGVKQAVARDLGAGGGWTLDPTNTRIELHGLLCDRAKQGAYTKVSVVFGCTELPPLPPPKPPS
jgi:hypothetical protein